VSLSTKQLAKFDISLQEALNYRNAGRLAEAEQVYRSILKRRPSHSDANSGLAHTLNAQVKLKKPRRLGRQRWH